MCKQGVRFFKRCEYEIIYSLKDKYSVKFLCEVMSVNRSGNYKWLARKDKPNRYEQDRIILTELLLEQHNKHKTKGYHYLANLIRNKTGWVFSDNLAHKCCKLAGIRSKTKRGRKIAGREKERADLPGHTSHRPR